MNRVACLCLMLSLFTPAMAARTEPASPPLAVTVLTFASQVQGHDADEWRWLEKGLADLVIHDLARQPGLQVVDRERMQETLTAEGLRPAGAGLPGDEVHERHLVERFVDRFAVQRLVFGSYRVDADTITLNATLVDAETGDLMQRVQVQGEAAQVLQLRRAFSARIVDALLDDERDLDDLTAAMPLWTESLPAAKLLYEAIDHFDHGQFDEAWLRARRVQRVDEDYADALYWVGRLHFYMLHYEHAQLYLGRFIEAYPEHARVPSAAREYVACRLVGIDEPTQALSTLQELRRDLPDLLVYESLSRHFQDQPREVPLHAWLSFRIAQVHVELGQHWEAWQEYEQTYARLTAESDTRWAGLYQAVCEQWDELWVDGQRILEAHPDHAVKVGPERNVFTWEPPKTDALAALPTNRPATRMPWLVAEEGWLIMGLTVRAHFRPATPDSKVRLRTRGQSGLRAYDAEGESWSLIELEHESQQLRSSVTVERQYTSARGVRTLGFVDRYTSPSAQHIEFEVELWPEQQTASLSLDGWSKGRFDLGLHAEVTSSGVKPWRFWMRSDIADRPDLFPDEGRGGWRPGQVEPGVTVADPRDHYQSGDVGPVELVAGERSEVAIQMRSWESSHVSRHGRRMRGIVGAEQYPVASVLPPTFRTRYSNPVAVPITGEQRQAYVPEQYYWQPRPSLVTDRHDRVHAYWDYRGQLWSAVTDDVEQGWSLPRRLPVPLQSAHNERFPHVFRDHLGRYCLVFTSDRGADHRWAVYVSISYDLEQWTRPRRIVDDVAAYAFVYQTVDNEYVLLMDGKDSVWQRTSTDLVDWTPAEPVVSWKGARSMYRPHVQQAGNGDYYLVVSAYRNDPDEPKQRPQLQSLVGWSRDGRQWERWQVLPHSPDRTNEYTAIPTDDGLLVHNQPWDGRRTDEPNRFHVDRAGAWSQGGPRQFEPAWPRFAGPAYCTPDGRTLIGASSLAGHVYSIEWTDVERDVAWAHETAFPDNEQGPAPGVQGHIHPEAVR